MCGRAILDVLERRLWLHSTAPSRAHTTREHLRTSHSPSPATSWHAPPVNTCQQQQCLESLRRNDREPPQIGVSLPHANAPLIRCPFPASSFSGFRCIIETAMHLPRRGSSTLQQSRQPHVSSPLKTDNGDSTRKVRKYEVMIDDPRSVPDCPLHPLNLLVPAMIQPVRRFRDGRQGE